MTRASSGLDDGGSSLFGDLDALALPTSLNALLGARLDSLEPGARATLERGAVEGEVFHRGAVVALVDPAARASVHADLEALAAKDFVRPAEASFAGEAAFRFKHLLVRDAAYQAHREAASRDSSTSSSPTGSKRWRARGSREYEEILGYHLEQSYRYRTELGPPDDEIRALGARAARRLAAAGDRAARRGDIDAASGLLGRASTLLPTERPDARTDPRPAHARRSSTRAVTPTRSARSTSSTEARRSTR